MSPPVTFDSYSTCLAFTLPVVVRSLPSIDQVKKESPTNTNAARNNGVPYNASSGVYYFFSRKNAFCKIPAMISSIRSITKTARNYVQLALLFSANPGQSTSASCPNAQLSCSSGATITNYCCFNYPGGLLLQTQFWDTNPPTGPSDSWTIHGLWSVHLWLLQIIFPIDPFSRPDNCDGTYEANCDPAREYTNIRQIISDAGATDLLSYMNTYWKDYQGDDNSFWSHEWGKHGTCISTLETSCYTNYVAKEEVVAYFQKAVDLFKTLPSYQVRQWRCDTVRTLLIVRPLVSLGCWNCSFQRCHIHRCSNQCSS